MEGTDDEDCASARSGGGGGQSGPEDLVAVPGTRWLIASAFGGEGGLFAIDTRAASSTKVHPVAAAAARLDKVDPNKWTYTTIVDYPTSPAIAAATVAIQVGDELWAGSFRGDRIARYPARGLR